MVYILYPVVVCSLLFYFIFTFYDLHNFFLFEFNSHILYLDFFCCVSAIIYMFSTLDVRSTPSREKCARFFSFVFLLAAANLAPAT